jgi:hypothetical protein
MGNPYFYLYYEPGGPLTAHDFGRSISDLWSRPMRTRIDARGGDGAVSSALGPSGMRVTIRRERTSDRTLVRMWQNVEDHLLAGGRVGFSWDHARTWAGWATAPTQNDTIVYTGSGNAFSAWSSSAALTSGDEIVIEAPHPDGRREYGVVQSISGGQIIVASAIRRTLTTKPMVRWEGFYPSLFLPEDQLDKLRVSSDRRITWSLDLELEVDPRILAYAQKSGMIPDSLGLRDGTVRPGGRGQSLEDLLRGGGSVAGSRAGSEMFERLYGGRR